MFDQDLEDLSQLITELNLSNSNNDKKAVLAKYPQCKRLLEYVYSPYKMFGVTSDNLKKFQSLTISENTYHSIFDLLDDLIERKITGHSAIAAVNQFIANHIGYEDIIYTIIDKDLKGRVSVTTINKIFPNLVPEFSVALANNYEDEKHRVDFENNDWRASRKLDGVRCITVIDDKGNVSFWSRNGKEFETLDKLREEIKSFNLVNMIMDGEVCVCDETGNEDFQNVMKEIRRKDHTILNPRYFVFDMLPLDEFMTKQSKENHVKRLANLQDLLRKPSIVYCRYVEQLKVRSNDELISLTREAARLGWEGLILRKNVLYEGKRSKDLLKVKQFHDAEYVVKGYEIGPFRVINEQTRLEETITTLTNILIEHKGYQVSVGSGFSLAQRKEFFNHPEKIVGQTITVKYFEETKNQNDGYSLRFPTVKYINRGDV